MKELTLCRKVARLEKLDNIESTQKLTCAQIKEVGEIVNYIKNYSNNDSPVSALNTNGELETIEGIKFKPIWNRQPCLYSEHCTKREEREKTLPKGRCMYNPSMFKCEEFQKFHEGVIYSVRLESL